MSRFFKGGSDSDSETSSSDDSYVSDEISQSDPSSDEGSDSEEESKDDGKGANAWLVSDNSGSETDEEEKKVVRSAKDKKFVEVENCVKNLENKLKDNDWVFLASEFDKMNKVVAKLKQTGVKAPTSYYQGLIILEDGLHEAITEKKKMNALHAKALNSMKQKLKKNNKPFEKEIKAVREGKDLNESTPVTPTLSQANLQQQADDSNDGFVTVGKKGKGLEFTPDVILKKLKEIVQARGKKNTDKDEQVRTLQKLFDASLIPQHKIRVLFSLISTRFDHGSGMTNFMPVDVWRSAYKNISTLFDILEADTDLSVAEDNEDIDEEDLENPKEYKKLRGSVISLIERLDDEFIKVLQNTDPHSSEYLERLSDEIPLVTIITRAQNYFEKKNQLHETTRVIIRRIEHISFKPDNVIKAVEKRIASQTGPFESQIVGKDLEPTVLLSTLCSYIYTHGEPLLRTRAMLHHIYNSALHGDYHTARDMLLMSHLQETIHQADVSTMVLYNRALMQIGIAAFKKGLIRDSLNCIQEIYNTGRVKDLLAQGVTTQRYNVANPEQEKIDKLRILPFHMHINLELLECIYLTCSMLLEIPNMAQAGSNPDARRNIISKPFRRLLDQGNRQVFSGPPENARDLIIAASKSLAAGEWEESRDYLLSIKLWDQLDECDKIKANLATKIQEEGLRAYLFTYSAYYTTLSLEQLASMFGLSLQSVNSILSKMIWNEELLAGLDQVRGIVVLHSEELSKVQLLSILVGEKLTSIVEANQKSFDAKMSEIDILHQSTDRRSKNSTTGAKKQIDHKYNSKKPSRNNFNQTSRSPQ